MDTTTTSKLTKAQQICSIEEAMAEEESAKYLDAWDMGQRIFGLLELNGCKHPGISSPHVQYTEELYNNLIDC